MLWLRWRLSVDIREFFAYQALLLLYLGSFCLLLLLLLLLFLSRRLVKPLERLGRAMEQLAQRGQGDGLEAEVIRGDEIGDLARSFVEMEAILRRHREQREEQIKALEEAHRALQRAQEELIQREKLSTIGQMAAGVAHEVGNPLSAIMGYSELLQETESWGEMEADLAARIYRETKRIDRIIRELLAYARPVQATERTGNPLRAIEETLALLPLQPRFREMKVTTHLPASLPVVLMAEASLIQILLNLLLNAADACEGQGQVEIRATHDEEAGGVSLWVEDSGAGIPEAIRERLFEPFFTTKAPGKGVGLGLAICQRLVMEAGGSLSLTEGRHPEKGACFLIQLKAAVIS
jgi:C4-dicarboxylate-specific signal transduction histidine kinase